MADRPLSTIDPQAADYHQSGKWWANAMRLERAMIAAVLLGAIASGSSAQITSTDNSVHPGSKPAVSLSLSVVPAQVKVGESITLYISLKIYQLKRSL